MKMCQYESKLLDSHGRIDWTVEENAVWQRLVTRQLTHIEGKACNEYFEGLSLLNLPLDRVPQIADINEVLAKTTGWQLEPVPALINFDHFFTLLADKKFPVATFIRTQKDFDYLQEPDYFHEVFGHCAMLTNFSFAAFTHFYGKLGMHASKAERVYLARLYWFTVEFGLIETEGERQIYGGGILSSAAETDYAFSNTEVIRKQLDIVDVMRTPYRIDIIQPVYFHLNDLDTLFSFTKIDLMACVKKAMALGLHSPAYPVKFA